MKNIILAGSSGLVGGFALKKLLNDDRVGKVILVSRTAQDIIHHKIIQVVGSLDLLDLVNLSDYGMSRVDAAICTLGSTIKKAGNKEAFKKVDKDFVINLAVFAKRFGSKQFGVVSALGADCESRFFYNKVKGEMEKALDELGFEVLTILRPSLILGDRKDLRNVEYLFVKISPFLSNTLIGPLKKFRGIEAYKIADHLVNSIFSKEKGKVIIENSEMLNL